MEITRLDIIPHVLTILYIGKYRQKFLIDNGISLVIKLHNSKDEAYQSLV